MTADSLKKADSLKGEEPDSSGTLARRESLIRQLEESGFQHEQAETLIEFGRDPARTMIRLWFQPSDFSKEQVDALRYLARDVLEERRRLMNPFNLLENPLSLLTGRLSTEKEKQER